MQATTKTLKQVDYEKLRKTAYCKINHLVMETTLALSFKITLKEAEGTATAVTLNYGAFIQTVFDFTIIAFAIFLVIKGMNKLRKDDAKTPAAPPAPTKDQQLLTEIRDLLMK